MTTGDQFVRSLPAKRAFYDRSEKRKYLLAREVARLIVDDPSLLRAGADHLQRFIRDDPHQKSYYLLWSRVLQQPPTEIARFLLADSEEGSALRDSCPVFLIVTPERRAKIFSEL